MVARGDKKKNFDVIGDWRRDRWRVGEVDRNGKKETESARRIDLKAVIRGNNKQQVSQTSQKNMAKSSVGVL